MHIPASDTSRAVKVNRTWAAGAAFLTALGICLITGGIIHLVSAQNSTHGWRGVIENLPLELAIFGGIALLIVLITGIAAARKDAENFLIGKATPLPIKFVSARDDVWIEGQIECPEPLSAPHFGRSCAHYHYVLKEKRTSGTGKDRRTEWVTLRDETQSAPYSIRDGVFALEIRGAQARYEYLKSESSYVFDYQHELTYLPATGAVSAVGVVSEDRHALESYRKIPLLVTPLPRHEWLSKAEWWKHFWRISAMWLLLPASFTLFWSAFFYLHWIDPPATSTHGWIVPLLLAGTVTMSYLIILIYNRLVTYQQRIFNAWSQVDVDLKMRHDLVPQLVEVVKGYRKHEQEVQKSLAGLRNGSAAAASRRSTRELADTLTAMDQQFQQLVMTVEKYPELKADALHRQLFEQMTALEEKIAHGRFVFNEAVREFNEIVQSFPTGLLFRFQAHPFWSGE